MPKQHQQAYEPLVRARLSECGKEAEILASHLSQLLKQAWSSNTKVVVCIEQALQSARPAKTTFAAVAEEYITTATTHHHSWQGLLLSIKSAEATSASLWAFGSG